LEQKRGVVEQDNRKILTTLQDLEREIMLSDGQLNYSNKDLIKIGEDKNELESKISMT